MLERLLHLTQPESRDRPARGLLRPIEAATRSFAGTTLELSTRDDWRPLFALYPAVA